MKVWKIAVILALALALVLGVTLPGLAASDEATTDEVECKPYPRLLRGEVFSIGESSFTIQDGDVEIRVNDDTRFFKIDVPQKILALLRHRVSQMQGEQQEQIRTAVREIPQLKAAAQKPFLKRAQTFSRPELATQERQQLALMTPGEGQNILKQLQAYLKWFRQFGEEVDFADLAPEDKVVVWVVPNEGAPLAKLVLIVDPTANKRVVGEVTDVGESSITVEPLSGDEAITFRYDENTTFTLRLRGTPFLEGQKAVVVYVEGSDPPLAKIVMAGMRVPRPAESE